MTRRDDVVGLDASILMHPQVWKASGHIDTFTDPLVDCKDCKNRFREDHGTKDDGAVACPKCGSTNVTEARNFNLMFKTYMGAVEGENSEIYLRPETAQGIFVNFENAQTSARKKIPFGIAQIGKSFRNEITPGNFIFRTREFEQMEMQYFVEPSTADKFFDQWKETRMNFLLSLGLQKDRLKFSEHGPKELAHYAKAAFDVEYEFPFGWQELEGIHNRGDYDLSQHQEFSGKKLEYFDEANKKKYIPYVVETAIGCDRLCLALLCNAYREEHTTLDNGKDDKRVVLGLKPELAPYKAGILPLSKKPPLQEMCRKIQDDLNSQWLVNYDETGSIGKRYRRQDEVGTPFCITIDFESIDDQQVTIRHRDTMAQDRIPADKIKSYLADKFINW